MNHVRPVRSAHAARVARFAIHSVQLRTDEEREALRQAVYDRGHDIDLAFQAIQLREGVSHG